MTIVGLTATDNYVRFATHKIHKLRLQNFTHGDTSQYEMSPLKYVALYNSWRGLNASARSSTHLFRLRLRRSRCEGLHWRASCSPRDRRAKSSSARRRWRMPHLLRLRAVTAAPRSTPSCRSSTAQLTLRSFCRRGATRGSPSVSSPAGARATTSSCCAALAAVDALAALPTSDALAARPMPALRCRPALLLRA